MAIFSFKKLIFVNSLPICCAVVLSESDKYIYIASFLPSRNSKYNLLCDIIKSLLIMTEDGIANDFDLMGWMWENCMFGIVRGSRQTLHT